MEYSELVYKLEEIQEKLRYHYAITGSYEDTLWDIMEDIQKILDTLVEEI